MNKLSEWFLSQSALSIFLLSLLVVPLYVWLYSIVYQLQKKRTETNKRLVVAAGLIATYTIGYFFFFIGVFFNLFGENSIDLYDYIMPFHLAAMTGGFLLMILGAYSYGKYEKESGYQSYPPVGVFFMLWFYIVGIWVLQPKLNEYI